MINKIKNMLLYNFKELVTFQAGFKVTSFLIFAPLFLNLFNIIIIVLKSKKVYTIIKSINNTSIKITKGLVTKLNKFSKVKYSYPVIFMIILKKFKNKGANIRKLVTLNPAWKVTNSLKL